jgi:hypothetical protein
MCQVLAKLKVSILVREVLQDEIQEFQEMKKCLIWLQLKQIEK